MEKLSKIKRKLLTDEVEELIFEYIINEKIPLNEKIPNEFEMADKFGVGRSTIREAVKSLVTKGILEVRRGSGTYVISTTTIETDPLGLSGVEDKVSLALDLVDVRLMLEPNIAEMAARKAGPKEKAELDRLCSCVEEKISKGENYIQEDIDFHTYIAECSGNMVVEQIIPIIDTAVMMFVNVTHKKLINETVITHRKIVEYITENDPIGAKTAMIMHLTFNRDSIKEILKKRKN